MLSIERALALKPRTKLSLMAGWDVFSLLVSLLLAYWIRVGVEDWHFSSLDWTIVVAHLTFTMSVLVFCGHYHQMIRYINLQAVYIIVFAVLASIGYLLMAKVLLGLFMPFTVPFIYFLFATSMLAIPRLLVQASFQMQSYRLREKCLIYGASETGRLLASALKAGNDLVPIGFVDDKRIYQGMQVMGLPVIKREEIPELVKKHSVKKMLLAVNNTSVTRRKELIAELETFAIELLSVPDLTDILSGKRRIDDLREINIEELLGREPVPPIASLLTVNIVNKCVMVTGAGGSIGSELCRQIGKLRPQSIILYELSEYNLYRIESELRRVHPQLNIVPVLASIQDTEVLRSTISTHKVDTIYHAAAYKHVPMVEKNLMAAVRNNIFGTANVALVATEHEVEKFVLVSTDKAVRPTNVMGATKRFAELFVQGLAENSEDTEFAIVRFGNVLGSSGSVVPLFNKQIREGGPITVTHPDIIRYFMTIPEAALLVIQAGAMGCRGEVFVLDMGEPVKIVDLATKMAHLLGHTVRSEDNPDGTIELCFSGLRPGEKLYEELLIDDAETDTQHPRIMGANEVKMDFGEVTMLLDRLNYAILRRDETDIRDILLEAPLAFMPSNPEWKKVS